MSGVNITGVIGQASRAISAKAASAASKSGGGSESVVDAASIHFAVALCTVLVTQEWALAQTELSVCSDDGKDIRALLHAIRRDHTIAVAIRLQTLPAQFRG